MIERRKRNYYDDLTLENMKRYFQVEDHVELLKFIKKHGLKNDDSDFNIKDHH
jgi:hypothetical protein